LIATRGTLAPSDCLVTPELLLRNIIHKPMVSWGGKKRSKSHKKGVFCEREKFKTASPNAMDGGAVRWQEAGRGPKNRAESRTRRHTRSRVSQAERRNGPKKKLFQEKRKTNQTKERGENGRKKYELSSGEVDGRSSCSFKTPWKKVEEVVGGAGGAGARCAKNRGSD